MRRLLRRPWLTLAVAALLLFLPPLIWGTLFSDSAALNLNWADQFARQVQAGTPYPRWLPDSFRGLGSPVFYFYPPLPFWLDALVAVVTADALSVAYRLAVTGALLLWASGLGMHRWLLAETGKREAALLGALAYMAAPYHLVDHYLRGAFAEFAAIAVLPLVMLALRGVADRRSQALPLLAICYAALLLSHLPTALLASVTLFPAYWLWRGRRAGVAGAALVVAGGALGIALAALYVAPALLLQDWISAAFLWSSFYRVEAWFFLAPGQWPDVTIMQVIVSLALAYVLIAAAVAVQARGPGFWTVLCVAGVVLVSGLVPWFWQLPELSKVQFPWRLMTVVEFAAITAACSVDWAPLRKPVSWILLAAALALLHAGVLTVRYTVEGIRLTQAYRPLPRIDAKEYLPNGLPGVLQGDEAALRQAADSPLIRCLPAARLCRATEGRFGELALEVDAGQPTTVVLHRFFFPAWRLDGGPAVVPSDPLRLLSFEVPAGRTAARLERVALPAERWGWAVSGLALVAWLLLLWRAISVDAKRAARA